MNPTLSIPVPQSKIRTVLLTDAVFSATGGLLFLLARQPLGEFLGVSPAVMAVLIAVQFGFAALIASQLARPTISRGFVAFTMIGNSAWVLASLLLLTLPAFNFSTEARWAIAVVAVCVDALATLQFLEWRKM